MKKNRFLIQQNLEGVQAQLAAAVQVVDELFMSPSSTIEQRNEAQAKVKDLTDRAKKYEDDLKKLDEEAAAKFAEENEKNNKKTTPEDESIKNKADLIKAAMSGDKDRVNSLASKLGENIFNALSTNPTTGNGGASILPKTTASEIITEPVYENDLRPYLVITRESNLEIPKILFTCDNDDFINDEETAKEIEAEGSTVTFGRFKSKLKVAVSETVLTGSATNLVATVEGGLQGAAAYKEVKQLFGTSLPADEAHMSFYEKEGSNYTIKSVSATDKFLSIKKAIADLPKAYRRNAKIIMAYADYLDIIETLANGNATLYTAQPESILGKPVIFMDEATIPVVGDLKYLQINYHPEELFDRAKDVDTGIEKFVDTNWFDIQFRLRSAFRLAIVTP